MIEGASRRSVGKPGRRIGRRRKSQVDAKAGLEGWPETQVEGWPEGRPEGWSPTQVGGQLEGKSKDLTVDESRRLGWKAEPEIGHRRKSEVNWKARLKG